jgi:hypothetical protein
MFLTDIELVAEISDADARELGANEAEYPVGCDCGGGASDVMWLVVGVAFEGMGIVPGSHG